MTVPDEAMTDLIARFTKHPDGLSCAIFHDCDQSSPIRQPRKEFLRLFLATAIDQHNIKQTNFRNRGYRVSLDDIDLPKPRLTAGLFRPHPERWIRIPRYNIAPHCPHDRRRITRTPANIEHTFSCDHLSRLKHPRQNHGRQKTPLAIGKACRAVSISETSVRMIHKTFAGNTSHRIKHRGILDIKRAQLAIHHHAAQFNEIRHHDLHYSWLKSLL